VQERQYATRDVSVVLRTAHGGWLELGGVIHRVRAEAVNGRGGAASSLYCRGCRALNAKKKEKKKKKNTRTDGRAIVLPDRLCRAVIRAGVRNA